MTRLVPDVGATSKNKYRTFFFGLFGGFGAAISDFVPFPSRLPVWTDSPLVVLKRNVASPVHGARPRTDSAEILRKPGNPCCPRTSAMSLILFGAGDGIRTHDPNLGKVVLYP